MADRTQGSAQILRIPGTRILDTPRSPSVIKINEQRTFRINATRAGDSDAPEVVTAPDEVVEIELDNGYRLWTSRKRLCQELIPPQEQPRGAGAYELPAGLSLQGQSRGVIGKILFKTLSFFNIDVPEKGAETVARNWENHVLGVQDDFSASVCRCATSGDFTLSEWKSDSDLLTPDKPIVLFLHGTASSTKGSFGELWGKGYENLRRDLFLGYEGNVLALEHRTLTRSPIHNALVAVRALPPRSRLHLISHSRGGLVGELLCRGQVEGTRDPFSADDFNLLNGEERADLQELNSLLKEKRITVERFVRVACPARGTSLASERLDIYLSIIFNLLKKVSFLSAGAAAVSYDIFSELVMAVAKERSDPSVLPGLEAMVPQSPLINLLNRPGCRVGGELRVIAGDIEGDWDLAALKALLVHPVFQGDNDLVVDSDAMFGGTERAGGAAFSFHQGPEVSHFRYFKNEDTSALLVKALTRKEKEEDGFKPFEVRDTDTGGPPYRRGEEGPRPVVFVVPALMGSHLHLGKERIWLDPGALALGGLHRLATTQEGIAATEPMWKYYSGLCSQLSSTAEVVPFPYDWRLSHEESAALLAKAVEEKLEQAEKVDMPVSIVAHSSGGMVVRAMLATQGETGKRLLRHKESRLILLGTPWSGSFAIAQLLTGSDSLAKKLGLLSSGSGQQEVLKVLATFPGLLELLPTKLLEPQAWDDLLGALHGAAEWQPPAPELLAAAKRVRDGLESATVNTDRILYLAGSAPATPVDMRAEPDADGRPAVVFPATPRGDGRVPWEQSLPRGMKVWYVPACHGDLASEPAAFDAISDLLQKGSTDRLDSVPPSVPPEAPGLCMPVEKSPLYPNFKDLASAALGGARQTGRTIEAPRTRVTVAHGDIGYSDCPILLGHYEGDTLVSAEAYLNQVLGGRLRERHRLGLYPGALDTEEIFLTPVDREGKKPKGAIIAGLGEVGKLTPGKLMRAVSRAVRAYAIALADNFRGEEGGGPRSAGICPLLVGTSAGGISVSDSLTAILRGISHAKLMLHEEKYDSKIVIDEVQFLELYEDRAIQAAHDLERVRTDPEISRCFLIEPTPIVRALSGGKRRASQTEDPSWWQRLQIVEDKAHRLAFNLLTDRAREEVYLHSDQRSQADQFVSEIAGSASSISEQVAVTLFEMLIPNDIKEYAPDRRNMVLVVNEAAARYPWEMMQERGRDRDAGTPENKPLSVQAGMVRRLQLQQFRGKVVTARGQRALVIGNPMTSFAPLPGAEEEARKVCKQLESFGYRATPLLGEDATSREILASLYEHDYRILHLAGHGVYEYETGETGSCDCCSQQTPRKKVSGMVIGPDQFLTPAQIAQMRVVPEIVFVNCCFLGKIEEAPLRPNNPPRLAANLATEFIAMGVRCVVAAGWAVDDAAAALFAEVFYRNILSSGTCFGTAVLEARRAVFASFPRTNTWGAYQCYGDPAYTLSSTGAAVSDTARRKFVAPAEVFHELENMAEEACIASETQRSELRSRVRDLEDDLPLEWKEVGQVCAAFGRVYGELGEFDRAIRFYQAACADEKSRCPVKTVEQRWNLQARQAVAEAASKGSDAAGESLKEAEENLLALTKAAGETVERWSLLGSVAKRRVMISSAGEKLDPLKQMAEYYSAACRLGTKQEKENFYPLQNWLTAQVLLHLIGASQLSADDFAGNLTRLCDAAVGAARCNPDFWSAVAEPDALLLRHLYEGTLGENACGIAQKYLNIRKGLGSPREFTSVFDQIDFLLDMAALMQDTPLSEKVMPKAKVVAALNDIRARLCEAG